MALPRFNIDILGEDAARIALCSYGDVLAKSNNAVKHRPCWQQFEHLVACLSRWGTVDAGSVMILGLVPVMRRQQAWRARSPRSQTPQRPLGCYHWCASAATRPRLQQPSQPTHTGWLPAKTLEAVILPSKTADFRRIE